jgi:hypothetical protein
MGSGNTKKPKEKKGVYEHEFTFTKRSMEKAQYRDGSDEREGMPAIHPQSCTSPTIYIQILFLLMSSVW